MITDRIKQIERLKEKTALVSPVFTVICGTVVTPCKSVFRGL